MVFAKGATTKYVGAVAAVCALAALIVPESADAFGAGAMPGVATTVGHVQQQQHLHGSSSFLRARTTRTGECSTTSLFSSYVVKPEMARSRACEWRKLRTRGPGFEEKVCFRVFSVAGPCDGGWLGLTRLGGQLVLCRKEAVASSVLILFVTRCIDCTHILQQYLSSVLLCL